MRRTNIKKSKRYFILTALINVILLLAVIFLMSYVKYLLNADIRINLSEIVTQNKDVITSKLMLEINNLDLTAKQLSELYAAREGKNSENLKEAFKSYIQESEDECLFIGTKEGTAVFFDNQELDISGRNYFQRSMEGKYNISERSVSRLDGKDIFVISVPIYFNEKIIGTVQKQYTPQEMYQICSISLFSEKGNMYIINSQGYILINSQSDIYSKESDNYYRMIYFTNPDAAKKLESDIKNNRSGFMETEINNEKAFSAYTPIEQIYDWYLITSVDTDAVSPNGKVVINLFYCILFGVVLFFAFIIFYYLTMKKKQQENIKKIAFEDAVTGGDTITKFELDLRDILEEHKEKQYYILTFDIDNFKYINSFYGFDTGDKILEKVYSRFKEKLKEDERLARVTSDHFAALLEDVSKQRLSDFFEPELNFDNIKVYLSAGLYPLSCKPESVSLMIDKANIAKQKTKGIQYKNIEIYSEDYDKKIMENEQMKRDVELALANGEIIPFFQPKVDVNTRNLAGAEALARWRKKDGSLIQPGAFISVCEQTGLIVQVDMLIYEQTLKFIRQNLDKGIKCVPISVNFSRKHLLNDGFVEMLFEELQEYGVPPELVEIELTETVIFDNYKAVEEFINRLHEKGMKISMDDFGSGYSSLHMLKDVDIDVLKIDRGFLKETVNSERQKIIFAAITRMAKQLKIKIVVEGVETVENVNLMKEFNCAIAQGYFYAKPMEQDVFMKVYEEGAV